MIPKDNIKKAINFLGWVKGNVHDVAKETGLSVSQILNSNDIEALLENLKKLKEEIRQHNRKIRQIERKIRDLE